MARVVDKAGKRLQLVEAAVAVFADKGFQRTAMDDVATAAGVAKGTLYQYFKNKEDLFYACFEWLQRITLQQATAAMPAAEDARESLRTLAQATVAVTRQHIDIYPLTLEVWAAAASGTSRERFSAAFRDLYSAYRQAVEAILRKGQADGEFRGNLDVPAVAAMLVGALDGLLLQYWLDRRLDVAAMAAGFVDGLLQGLEQPKSPGGER